MTSHGYTKCIAIRKRNVGQPIYPVRNPSLVNNSASSCSASLAISTVTLYNLEHRKEKIGEASLQNTQMSGLFVLHENEATEAFCYMANIRDWLNLYIKYFTSFFLNEMYSTKNRNSTAAVNPHKNPRITQRYPGALIFLYALAPIAIQFTIPDGSGVNLVLTISMTALVSVWAFNTE